MDLTKIETRFEINDLARKLRLRATAGRNALLSPRTALLVADALDAYAPKTPATPHRSPDDRFAVDMYSSGSTVYRLFENGEIMEVAAWAKNTLVARAAFDALTVQYPKDRFRQKRRSWVERE